MCYIRAMKWKVVRYRRANGEIPFDDFMAKLPVKDKARVIRTVDLLEMFGTELREPYARKIRGAVLWELRIRCGSNAYRVFYAGWKDRSFYLFHGFLKKAQKTPRKELERAKGYLAEMKERSQ